MNGDRQRKRVYLAVAMEINFRADGENTRYTNALVTEISDVGLKFVTSSVLKKGAVLEVKLLIKNVFDPIYTKVEVIWQRQISTGSLILEKGIGGYLLNTNILFTQISDNDRKRLIGYMKTLTEKVDLGREHVRLPLVVDANYSLAGNQSKKFVCVIGDIGVNGMKLFVRENLRSGENLVVSFDLPDMPFHLSLAGVVVRRVEQKQGIFALGIEFIDLKITDKEKLINFISKRLI